MMHRANALIAGCLAGSLIFAPGCTRKYVAKVAPFERGTVEAVVKPAPRSGMYHVQFVANDRYLKNTGATPTRYVMKGEPVGFRESTDGQVVALVGNEELPVVGLPPHATHVMWYHKSKRPTQFAKSMTDAGESIQKALIAVGIGAGAVAVGALYLNGFFDDDCDDVSRHVHKQRKHKRH